IMLPGSISICSGKISTGGTAMFALLAMAGDLGGALGPAIVGNITQNAGNDMQKGMLSGCAFPLILLVSLLLLNRAGRRNN
ncbi:MAG: MFS transporter, partial [Oscillospiraceae bacterium]|nr:MFS transporter [Oscillospiraceae bacterium]